MSRRKSLKNALLMISSFLIGGISMLFVIQFTPYINTKKSNFYTITKNDTQIYEKASLAAAVEKIYDAVVVIQGYNGNVIKSTGTGFVYKVDDKYGYLLTNEHVIADSKRINVIMTNEEEANAEVLGKDEYLDIAVLRVDKKYVISIAEIGQSETMKLGDTIFTVGSPVGYEYRGSVTSGVLSGKDRMVSLSTTNSSTNDWVMKVLQIDASINSGNSGGPLLNVNGEVVGICTMKLINNNIEGIGFAIPIEDAMKHIEDFENGRKLKWPELGIGMANISETSTITRNNISIPENIIEGVVVVSIKDNSAADNSHLQKGDIIKKIDNQPIKDKAILKYIISSYQPGDSFEITYIREEKEYKTKVELRS